MGDKDDRANPSHSRLAKYSFEPHFFYKNTEAQGLPFSPSIEIPGQVPWLLGLPWQAESLGRVRVGGVL